MGFSAGTMTHEFTLINGKSDELKHKSKHIKHKISQLNDTLLRNIKSLVPSAVYQLFYNEVSSRWGKLHRLETTDFICDKSVSDAEKETTKINEGLEIEKKQLKHQVQSLIKIQAESDQSNLIEDLENKLNQTVDNLMAQLTLLSCSNS